MRASSTRSCLRLLVFVAAIGACLAAGASAATITTFPVEAGAGPGVHNPKYIAASPLGELWFTDEGKKNGVRAINAAGAPLTAITQFSPLGDLAFAADGTLFWTAQDKDLGGVAFRSPGGTVAITNSGANFTSYAVGFTKAGAVEFTAESEKQPHVWRTCNLTIGCTDLALTRLTDLTLDSQGALWAMQPEGDVARRLPAGSLAVNLPTGSRPGRAALGPDGNLWIAGFGVGFGPENATNQIIRLTPGGEQKSFPLPPGRGPNDIALGPDGALWFTEFISGSIGRMTTSGEYSSCPLPNAAASPHPYGIVAGADGALWFTEYDAGLIGRISGPPCGAAEAPPPPSPAGTPNPSLPPQPKVSGLALAPSAFRAMKAGGPLVPKRLGGAGSQLTFTASATTAVAFALERKLPGRRAAGRCVAQTGGNRAKPACTRLLPFGQPFSATANAGANALVFSGRLGSKALSAGGYRLSARVGEETQSSVDFRVIPAQR